VAIIQYREGGLLVGTIGQLMTRDLSFVSEDASIQDAAKHMYAKRIGSLLVKKESEFSGIVTETDVVQAVAEQPAAVGHLTVQELMSSPIITVDRNMSPHYARDLMADRKIRHLAVTENEKIVGIVSVRDLLSYFKTVSKELDESEE
jgi:signal-transduction protein with cAMP-binding, CBS, and nucleotidyltransferase domain